MRSRELGSLALVGLLAACGAGRSTANDNGARERDRAAIEGEGPHALGASTTRGSTTDGVVTSAHTSGVMSGTRAAGSCPSRFGEPGPTCNDGDVPVSCGYPEGTCSCETGTWCGGAAPPPMPLEWRCRAHRSPCAAEGSPCSAPGAHCALDDCGFHGMRCDGGVWRSYMTPPPP